MYSKVKSLRLNQQSVQDYEVMLNGQPASTPIHKERPTAPPPQVFEDSSSHNNYHHIHDRSNNFGHGGVAMLYPKENIPISCYQGIGGGGEGSHGMNNSQIDSLSRYQSSFYQKSSGFNKQQRSSSGEQGNIGKYDNYQITQNGNIYEAQEDWYPLKPNSGNGNGSSTNKRHSYQNIKQQNSMGGSLGAGSTLNSRMIADGRLTSHNYDSDERAPLHVINNNGNGGGGMILNEVYSLTWPAAPEQNIHIAEGNRSSDNQSRQRQRLSQVIEKARNAFRMGGDSNEITETDENYGTTPSKRRSSLKIVFEGAKLAIIEAKETLQDLFSNEKSSGLVHFSDIHIIPRQHLSKYVRPRENGTWQASVSLVQPHCASNEWTNPQGQRPDNVTVGYYATEMDAIAACSEEAPPVWTSMNDSAAALCGVCRVDFTQRRLHHCRNCGVAVCGRCSRSSWPASMLPNTYHNNERKVRVCDFCVRLSNTFREALKVGNEALAIQAFQTGNVNVRFPYSCFKNREYPIHCAAEGGNLTLIKWLLEDLRVPLKEPSNDALLRTQEGNSVLAVAAKFGRKDVIRWLVLEKGCDVKEIQSKPILWNAIEVFIRNERETQGGERAALSPNKGFKTPSPVTNRRVSRRDKEERKHQIRQQQFSPDLQGTNINAQSNSPVLFHLNKLKEYVETQGSPGKKSDQGIDQECVVCMESKVNIVLVPCGHMCCCKSCVTKVRECPLCRCEINNFHRIYKL